MTSKRKWMKGKGKLLKEKAIDERQAKGDVTKEKDQKDWSKADILC
jgi:hypothetical protein